ncbi:hypothetical protein [Devosia sp. DBB001]|nr:hypothetical protein [Devosia sp. DBB001]
MTSGSAPKEPPLTHVPYPQLNHLSPGKTQTGYTECRLKLTTPEANEAPNAIIVPGRR